MPLKDHLHWHKVVVSRFYTVSPAFNMPSPLPPQYLPTRQIWQIEFISVKKYQIICLPPEMPSAIQIGNERTSLYTKTPDNPPAASWITLRSGVWGRQLHACHVNNACVPCMKKWWLHLCDLAEVTSWSGGSGRFATTKSKTLMLCKHMHIIICQQYEGVLGCLGTKVTTHTWICIICHLTNPPGCCKDELWWHCSYYRSINILQVSD